MITRYITNSGGVKSVEKVLAAVHLFLESGTNHIGKVAETPYFYDGKMANAYVYCQPCTAVNAISA